MVPRHGRIYLPRLTLKFASYMCACALSVFIAIGEEQAFVTNRGFKTVINSSALLAPLNFLYNHEVLGILWDYSSKV